MSKEGDFIGWEAVKVKRAKEWVIYIHLKGMSFKSDGAWMYKEGAEDWGKDVFGAENRIKWEEFKK